MLIFICGSCSVAETYLDGSISTRFDLDFDFLEMEKDPGKMAFTYYDEINFAQISYQGFNTVLKFEVFFPVEDFNLGQWVTVTDGVRLSRYVVIMVHPYLLKQDERVFPEIHDAGIGFFMLDDTRVNGRFKIIFKDGSTLRAGFSGEWVHNAP
jgi:hypothetical protein